MGLRRRSPDVRRDLHAHQCDEALPVGREPRRKKRRFLRRKRRFFFAGDPASQNSPTILPSGLTSIASADGTLGRPGMVMISPQITTTNSAPAESRTSRIGMVKSVGAPLRSGLVEKLYCVLAMQ